MVSHFQQSVRRVHSAWTKRNGLEFSMIQVPMSLRFKQYFSYLSLSSSPQALKLRLHQPIVCNNRRICNAFGRTPRISRATPRASPSHRIWRLLNNRPSDGRVEIRSISIDLDRISTALSRSGAGRHGRGWAWTGAGTGAWERAACFWSRKALARKRRITSETGLTAFFASAVLV